MAGKGNKSTNELLKKHKPLTRKQILERMEEKARIKKKMTQDSATLESNLKAFNKITDPLSDPETGKVLCWIRRPTTTELEEMIPAELMKYRNSPKKVPDEIMNKHKDFQFKMMASLITNPERNAEWWKKHTNLVFQQLFQLHLQHVMEDVGVMAANF